MNLKQGEIEMDTDALLVPAMTAPNNEQALRDVIAANTAAFKIIRVALSTCNSQEKVQAIIGDVEQAMQDLSVTSQKVEAAVRKPTPQQQQQADASYGQYPVHQPFNPTNPVDWPPDYVPPPDTQDTFTSLNYNYQVLDGPPPNGFCYQSTDPLGEMVLSFALKDSDTNNNAGFFTTVAIGDTIEVNSATWTIYAFRHQGAVFEFMVYPPQSSPPYGACTFIFERMGATKVTSDKKGKT
jgi:hypothetical protein